MLSPVIGMLAGFGLMIAVYWIFQRASPHRVDRVFRVAQLGSSALFSFSHGANDAQKTMAAITLALVASGDLPKFQVPLWVVILSAATIAFGTYAGGWRIIRTLGWSILKLDPATGMSAQLTGATVIQVATLAGLPVSTTHVITGSVMGVGASRRLSAVRWGLGANIAAAWIITIPATASMAWIFYAILSTAGLRD